MAKIKHNNFLDTVDQVITEAKAEGILHLRAEDAYLTGRQITVNGIACYHFRQQETRIMRLSGTLKSK